LQVDRPICVKPGVALGKERTAPFISDKKMLERLKGGATA